MSLALIAAIAAVWLLASIPVSIVLGYVIRWGAGSGDTP